MQARFPDESRHVRMLAMRTMIVSQLSVEAAVDLGIPSDGVIERDVGHVRMCAKLRLKSLQKP